MDDSREGIERYLKRNLNTCFAAVQDGRIIGVILTGHDGRRGIIHHMCVHPEFRRMGIAAHLVSLAEEALKKEGIQKVFGLVFTDNEAGNLFWEKQGWNIEHKRILGYDEFVVLFGTGMRVSEFCGLTKKDVDFENRKIHVDHQLCRERQRDRRCYFVEKTKTEAGKRDIPMTDEVFVALKNIVNNRPHMKTEMIIDGYSGFLLIDKNGNPKVALHIENEFRWAEHKYKKLYPNKLLPHITPHVARHTFATRMAQSGMDVKALQYLMGHSDAGVTMNVYTHTSYDFASKQFDKFSR